MKVSLLDALTVVSLRIGQAKQPLLQKGARPQQSASRTPKTGRNGPYSFSFQKAKAMFCRPWVSQTPAMPSSPHLYARDRAWSCGKSSGEQRRERGAKLLGESKKLTAPGVTVSAVVLSHCIGLVRHGTTPPKLPVSRKEAHPWPTGAPRRRTPISSSISCGCGPP